MSHAVTHKRHHVPASIIIALAIVIVLIGTLLVTPYITQSTTALIPVTGHQNAYTEYLIGEKTLYAMPAMTVNALTAYRSGEKTIYGFNNPSMALSTYRFGEKHVMSALEYALLNYHMGEKDY